MNCRPGDLARIVGDHPFLRVSDRIVRLKNEPQYYIGSDAYWKLEKPLTLLAIANFLDARGNPYRAGQVVHCDAMADEHLRPIRGGDVTDEEVRALYAPGDVRCPALVGIGGEAS